MGCTNIHKLMNVPLLEVIVPEEILSQEWQSSDKQATHTVADHIGLDGRDLSDVPIILYESLEPPPDNGRVRCKFSSVRVLVVN